MDKELFTVDEACIYLRQGRRAVIKLINDGNLKAFKTERKWFIPRTSLEDFIQTEVNKQNKKSNSERRGKKSDTAN